MSDCLHRILARGGMSVFDRLVAFTVYDGPVTGAAFCKDSNDPVLFRLEAWDDQQAVRVFSLAPLPVDDGAQLLETLASVDSPRWPEWWLKAPSTPEGTRSTEDAISRALRRAGPVGWVVVTENLLAGFTMAVRVADGAFRQEFERLSHRTSPDAEVSDGSFAQWLSFIEGHAVAR